MSTQNVGPLKPLAALAALVVFLVLLLTLAMGIAPNIDTRLVQIGEWRWPGYAKDLRSDPVAPDCDVAELDALMATCTGSGAASDDPFAGEDPFAEPGVQGSGDKDPFAGEDPFADPPAGDQDPFAGEDPFADPSDQAGSDQGDPFGGEDPFAEGGTTTKDGPSCEAVQNLRSRCEVRHTDYTNISGRITPEVRSFRRFELAVSAVAQFPFWKHLLVLMVVLGAITTTVHRVHIALRMPRNTVEHGVSQGAQLFAHLLLLASNFADWQVQQGSDAEIENPELPMMWGVGFAVLVLINLFNLVRPPKSEGAPTSFVRLLMVVPLYAWLAVLSGLYFLLVEGHASGQAIYLHKFIQIPSIYLAVGLYIWAGMLFRITQAAELTFDVFKPFGLPPALLAWLVIVLSAIPTAYSGASGIFVLAAGAVIFEQLTKAAASPRLALAATAMSGSLGVVLRPCLVVVLIATLNKQVTTAELFGMGFWVFLLTALLSLVAMLVKNRGHGFQVAPMAEAWPKVRWALGRLAPYFVISLVVLGVYRVLFATKVSEHTAYYVLPGLLLALVLYDRKLARPPEERAVLRPLVASTDESSHHVGAILMLMTASVCLGGVVERSDIMALVPESFGSMWITMAVLVVVMVLVGMTMDALGAVVLVSVSLASVAYQNGIHPVHFWMMVLVAFELGYLTPPVSLNHLLARQVVGAPAAVENTPVEGGFVAQYEHIIMPMAVMGTALVLVAFVPLLFYPL